jgi:hypothetical protein
LPAHPYHVRADPTRFQQILWNLVKNAAKFTPERGDIYISISKSDDDRIRVQVRDTGIGIASHVLTKIFDAFEQGDASITQQFGGMGLDWRSQRRWSKCTAERSAPKVRVRVQARHSPSNCPRCRHRQIHLLFQRTNTPGTAMHFGYWSWMTMLIRHDC